MLARHLLALSVCTCFSVKQRLLPGEAGPHAKTQIRPLWGPFSVHFLAIFLWRCDYFFMAFFSFFFLRLHLQHMEVPRLGVESGLQLLVYTSHSNARSELHLETYTAAHGNIGSLTL